MAPTIPTICAPRTDTRSGADPLQPSDGVVLVRRPANGQACPVILASPHSGRDYDAELRASTRLPLELLRRSEDAFVDKLIDFAPEYGASLVCAEFPRVFVDVNRGAGEVDPGMFSDRIPVSDIEPSRRADSGLGVIPRIGAEGRSLYRRRLRFQEARARLDRFYHPYHQALRAEISDLKTRFGHVILADMHSMPASSARGADIVLGDRFGTSCHGALTDLAEAVFRDHQLVTVRNNPYAGGYTTEHYGRPHDGVHVIQIEINRGLYLDENRVRLTADHASLIEKLRFFVKALAETDWQASF